MPPVAFALVVRGRVQGVGFRAFAERAARECAVAGWVRNRADGSVEVHAEGEASAVAALVRRLQAGPSAARVDAVDQRPVEVGGFRGFSVRPTA